MRRLAVSLLGLAFPFLLDAVPVRADGPIVATGVANDLAFGACLGASPNAVLSGAQINLKAAPSNRVNLRVGPPPAAAPAKWYTNPACTDRFIADFEVTSASTLLDSGMFKFYASAAARTGDWFPQDDAVREGELDVDKKCQSPPYDGAGSKAACLGNTCRKLVSYVTYAWKKHGESSFKAVWTGTLLWADNGYACQAGYNGKLRLLSKGEYDEDKPVPGTNKTQGQVDGFRRLPKPGEKDVYRVIVETGVSDKPTWEYNAAGPMVDSKNIRIARQIRAQGVLGTAAY
jgi:hypothetical protein